MEDFVTSLIAAAWLIVLAIMVVSVLHAVFPRRAAAPPFLKMLGRHGLTVKQAEEVAGFRGVAQAAERCAGCPAREACERALRWRWLRAPACPNASFFARAAGKEGA